MFRHVVWAGARIGLYRHTGGWVFLRYICVASAVHLEKFSNGGQNEGMGREFPAGFREDSRWKSGPVTSEVENQHAIRVLINDHAPAHFYILCV